MKKYEIWAEGYLTTGMEGIPQKAQKLAEVEAESFQEACDKHFAGDKLYDSERLTYWACNLFDNEKQARGFLG